ncbi:MAG TPA: DUF2723 domain-containing protein, partial [Gemmatimonadaceae bacterium]
MKRPDAAVGSAVVLFAVYTLTLAPDVTFWDAGEFIAAARTLGVPHPPGTPLFILLANTWARFVPLSYAVATNLLSAAATALAAGITARIVHRGTGSGAMAAAAAIAAGAMSTAWSNATETEVYAAALALGMLSIWAGGHAGRTKSLRWTLLTAYLIALAVPLHLSALVTAPVAIVMASMSDDGPRWRTGLLLSGAFLMSIGAGRVSWWLAALGIVVTISSVIPPDGERRSSRALTSLATIAVVGIACSAVMFMLVRAGFDPGLNQGDPDTLQRLANVIGRRQYAVAPLWPRMAPPWVQVANLGQYMDWQVALSAGPTVDPSLLRTLATAAFIALGFLGGFWHWTADRRSWTAVAGLMLCGSVGVIVYLNLHAGPSFGFPGLGPDAVREARERDYFFVFGFWAWGVWAGMGAVALARQWKRPDWTGVLVAAVPIVLNWHAVTRRDATEALVPRRWAEALLESAPPRAVLFVAGDNDTYPLWYSQHVNGVRPDVAVVTLPLLATRWYRDEVGRRDGLSRATDAENHGRAGVAMRIADEARSQGRAVVASMWLTADERQRIAPAWTASGVVFVAGGGGIDSAATARWAAWVDRELPARVVRPAIDPVTSYVRGMLDCPRQ